MPMPPGIYSGRGKAQRTGDLPLGKGFDWTRTIAVQKEAAREEQLRSASIRPASFQTLQQFAWLPQHSRTSPIRQYPPSRFSRTPASFLADRPGFKMSTTQLSSDFSMSNFHRKTTNISTADFNRGKSFDIPPPCSTRRLGDFESSQHLDHRSKYATTSTMRTNTMPMRNYNQQNYAHVLTPAGVRRPMAVERRPVSPLRSVNGYQGIWD